MQAKISITPNECLADEKVKILVQGLQPNQHVTIYATLERSDVGIFESFAHYAANQNGILNLSCDASSGGFYTGVEPMGLFWSMKPSPKNTRLGYRLTVKDLENPIAISFSVLDSHLKYDDLFSTSRNDIAKAVAKRWYKSRGVQRIPVRWNRVRGTLFIPEGSGPFPALIDAFGMAGRVAEYRASLFASRGYVSLALAYCGYDDLPDFWDGIDLEYFEEAKEFLQSLPETNQHGIGIVGTSFAGMLALACASYIRGFTCAVSINGPVFSFRTEIRYKGQTWQARMGNWDNTFIEDGAVVEKYCFDDDYVDFMTSRESVIDFAGSDKSFLFIFGQDDNALNNVKAASFTEKLIQKGKGDYKILTYPGAGHLLEPPHFPHASITYFKLLSENHHWGGETKNHARAQELAWLEIMAFLDKNLKGIPSKL